jgi:purine-nucleoside phosphorylase
MATPHNAAEKSQIAKTVLLPGDPHRAQYIAEKYLPDSVQVTSVRGMLGFTGTWKGSPLTVMGSGMGGPSVGIYSYELFHIYGVDRIIRIGTAGGLQDDLPVGSLVFAMTASTDSAYAHQYKLPGTFSPCADHALLERAVASARSRGIAFRAGAVFSSDLFSSYNALGPEESWKVWARMGCLAQDMETYALYCNAHWLKKRTLSILTHTDSCVTGEGLPQERRMTALHAMFDVALDVAAESDVGATR